MPGNEKRHNITIEGIIALLVTALVGTMLRTSELFVEFSHTLGIDSDFARGFLAAFLAATLGIIIFLGLSKLFNERK